MKKKGTSTIDLLRKRLMKLENVAVSLFQCPLGDQEGLPPLVRGIGYGLSGSVETAAGACRRRFTFWAPPAIALQAGILADLLGRALDAASTRQPPSDTSLLPPSPPWMSPPGPGVRFCSEVFECGWERRLTPLHHIHRQTWHRSAVVPGGRSIPWTSEWSSLGFEFCSKRSPRGPREWMCWLTSDLPDFATAALETIELLRSSKTPARAARGDPEDKQARIHVLKKSIPGVMQKLVAEGKEPTKTAVWKAFNATAEKTGSKVRLQREDLSRKKPLRDAYEQGRADIERDRHRQSADDAIANGLRIKKRRP